MKTIVFNYIGSKLAPVLESFALRLGYLFSDQVLSVGTNHMSICFEQMYVTTKLEQMIERVDQYHRLIEPGYNEQEAEQSRQTLKLYKKAKHPPRQLIIAMKQFEKALEKEYLNAKNYMVALHEKTGLPQLYDLYKSEAIDIYAVLFDDPEKSTENYVAVSDLLQLKEPDPETTMMFGLTSDFFLPDWRKEWNVVNGDHFRAANANNIYLHHCFTVPNLNLLNAGELKAARDGLAPALADFKTKAGEWMNLWQEQATAGNTWSYFYEHVTPVLAPLLAALGDSEILQRCSSLMNDKVFCDIYIGEMPLYALWDYYRSFDAVKDETWKKLEEVRAKGTYDKRRVPVMIFNQSASGSVLNEAPKEEEAPASKKSLSID